MSDANVIFTSKLDSVYQKFRPIQADHNETETRCIGAGNCCFIGLRIPFIECYNIAKNIQKDYYFKAESQGWEVAKRWYQNKVNKLIQRMYDKSWDGQGGTEMRCAMYENGCDIYEYRPLVCRAYGVIMPVHDTCPRNRLPDGNIEVFEDELTDEVITEFDSIIQEFGEAAPNFNYSVYMPSGVLRFLLTPEKLQELQQKTDPKFWTGADGYPNRFRRENWERE